MIPSASGTRGSRLQVRRLHHSGPAPLRVLVVGDERPVRALADRVVDRIWLSTRRGVDVDVLSDLRPVLLAVDRTFAEWRLGRYEAVVLVVDGRLESPLRVRTVHRLRDVLRRVLADTADASRVIVAETAGTHAGTGPGRVERVVRQLLAPRVAFCGEADAEHPLVDSVCAEIRAGLAPGPAAGRRDRPDDETGGPQALDDLGVADTVPELHLGDLVELARTAFGTECAEITFLDHDGQWKTAVAGPERRPDPRAHSFCTGTIEQAEPTVIPDAALDERMRDSALVQGPHPIRFYAAHPIDSVDGHRIGSFCVYDSAPRDPDEINVSVLRDLALLAQAEITGIDGPPVGAPPVRR